jgi:HK97 family phage portal protein
MSWLSRVLGTDRPAPPMVRAEPQLAAAAPQLAAAAPQLAGKQVATTTDTAMSAPLVFGALGYFASNTGIAVTPATSLTAPTVYACVKCLSEDLGKLPLVVRRRVSGGGWRPDPAHPLNALFRKPNRWQSSFEFKSFLVTSFCLRGNAYAVILRDEAGQPRRLIPIAPDRVGIYLSPEGWIYYGVSHPLVGQGITVHQDDMIHIRGMSLDGYTGLSPIACAADAIGLSLATQQHGAVLFRQGAQVAGVIKAAGKLSPEAHQRLAQSWQNVHAGVQSAHKTAILEEGLSYEKISMTSEEAQFINTRIFQITDVCRIFRTPPHKVMHLADAHYSNIEQSEIAYVKDALTPIATRFEQMFDETLLFSSERNHLSVRFDFDELMRGDTPSRYGAYAVGLQNGILSVNEVRGKEGMPGIGPAGDSHRVPLNTGAIGDARPDSAGAVTAPEEPAIRVPPTT